MDKSAQREVFEGWADDGFNCTLKRDKDGNYCDRETYAAWEAWQAATEQASKPQPDADDIAWDARVKALEDAAQAADKCVMASEAASKIRGMKGYQPTEQASQPQGTPGSRWAEAGEPDPHDDRYNCERAALCMGDLTDDELANAAFLNYDRWPRLEDIIAGKAHPPIAYMIAVKDRIRWLSRKLAEATKSA